MELFLNPFNLRTPAGGLSAVRLKKLAGCYLVPDQGVDALVKS